MASTETIYRSCPTCEVSCGLVMEVDRANREILSIKGDEWVLDIPSGTSAMNGVPVQAAPVN